LDDSIEPFDLEHGTGTGFKFKEYTGEALLFAVRQALHHYMDERIWKRIQLNGNGQGFFVEDACGGVCEAVRGRASRSRNIVSRRKVQEKAAPGSGQPGRGRAEPAGFGEGRTNQKPVGTSN